MFDFLNQPFGVLLNFISENLAFRNYGLTIIFFTIFIKILLFPLNLKQQKSTIRMQAIQPELDALKESCGGDKNLLMQEQQKIYSKYNVNPAGGCLPTLIQLPVLIVVYNIIISPLTYIAKISADSISSLTEIAKNLGMTSSGRGQLEVNAFFLKNPQYITDDVKILLGNSDFVNMTFLKIFDLGTKPTACFSEKWFSPEFWALVPLLLIPIITLVSQYALQWLTQPKKKKKDNKAAAQDPTQRSMNLMLKFMPLMTFFIALTTPAGLGFYWAIGNILTLLQTYLTNKFFLNKKEGL